jgi:hypothetical protein
MSYIEDENIELRSKCIEVAEESGLPEEEYKYLE